MARMPVAPKMVVSPKRAALNAVRAMEDGARISRPPLSDDEHGHSLDRALAAEKRRTVALVIQARKHGRAEGFRQADSAWRVVGAWALGAVTSVCFVVLLHLFR